MFSSIYKYFSGGPAPGASLEGQLWTVSSVKSAEKCLFLNAQMSVRPSDKQFEHKLVISRIFEEGEDLQPGEENAYAFPLTIDTLLILYDDDNKQWFQWNSKQGKLYAFNMHGRNDTAIQAFIRSAYLAIYENLHQTDRNAASNNDLLEIQQEIERRISAAKFTTGPPQRPSISNPSTPAVQPPTTPAKTPATTTTTNMPPPSTPIRGPPRQIVPVEGTAKFTCTAQLYNYDSATQRFLLYADNCTVTVNEVSEFDAMMYLVGPDGRGILGEKCTMDMNLYWQPDHLSLIWNKYEEGVPYTWSIKFNDPAIYKEFVDTITRCLYENAHQMPMAKSLKDQDDQDYVRHLAYDVDMEDADEFHDAETESEDEEEEDGGAYLDDAMSNMSLEGGRNSHLQVGVKHNRAFVSRGNNIGVFRNNFDENRMEFVTNISGLTDLAGDKLTPRQLMLHKEDSKMVMMKPGDDQKMYVMDLERGQVVEEWKSHDIIGVKEIAPREKFSQATGSDLMVGINSNRIMVLDGRLKDNKVVEAQSYAYVGSKPELQCLATTQQGYLVVGSEKGDIRMFNKLEMKAKTLLPGLGDPIIGIDVSADGKWVLATCKSYIILVNTESSDKSFTGFTKSISKHKNPPIILKVKPEHVAVMGVRVAFTPAKFNTGEKGEKYIVSGMGPYVLQWDFNRVKRRLTQEYTIKKYSSNVVADQFAFNQDTNVIVALDHDITMANKRQFATPQKMGYSRNDIVNSPY